MDTALGCLSAVEGDKFDVHTTYLLSAALVSVTALIHQGWSNNRSDHHPRACRPGTEVWCDTGYPRKVMTPGPGEELRADCVCQRGTAVTRGRRLFTGCLGTEQRCRAPELDDTDDGDL